MSKNQQTAIISVAISAFIAILTIFGYNVTVVQPALDAQSWEAPAGGTSNLDSLELTSDLTVGGDAVITGGLSVTGGVTGTNVLTTSNQTIAGVKTFSTAIAVGAMTGPVGVTGPTAVATATPAMIVNNLGAANNSFEVRDAATPVFTVRNGGAVAAQSIYSLAPVLVKDANYAVLATDTGALIKNTSVVSATFTLPAAAAGLNYCVFNYSGSDVIIEFTDSADVALNEVNSAGDSVTNTTAYDHICLTAIDAVNWVTGSSIGTWADGN